jgi:methylated-DNA-[protein]-cysteine S-methyltransferase
MRAHVFPTAHGFAAIAWRDGVVTGMRLPAPLEEQAAGAILRQFPHARIGAPDEVGDTIAAVQRYFAGEPTDLSRSAVSHGPQSDHATRVYAHIRRLAWGETTTYGAVARALGDGPHGARAVGRAMAANPVPLLIPCHRVIGANGGLGGFTAPGGGDAKARMLALEGVIPSELAQHALPF